MSFILFAVGGWRQIKCNFLFQPTKLFNFSIKIAAFLFVNIIVKHDSRFCHVEISLRQPEVLFQAERAAVTHNACLSDRLMDLNETKLHDEMQFT